VDVPHSFCLAFSFTVTLLAKLAKSTGLRLLSGALGAAPAAGIKLVSVLTLVKTSCVMQLDATVLWLLDGSVLSKDDMVTRQ
jgi:hypothetical protein